VKLSGRLSRAKEGGNHNPPRFVFRLRSPLYMPRNCGKVTCDLIDQQQEILSGNNPRTSMAVGPADVYRCGANSFRCPGTCRIPEGIPCPGGSASRGVPPRGVCLGSEIKPFFKFGGDGDAGFLNPFLGRSVIVSRINRIGHRSGGSRPKAVDFIDLLDFIAKAIDADIIVVRDERGDIDDVAMDAERTGLRSRLFRVYWLSMRRSKSRFRSRSPPRGSQKEPAVFFRVA
jgi:hypothetical protein